MTGALSDPRSPNRIIHDVRTLLAQRIYTIALGYQDGKDQHDPRHDPLLQILTERGADPAKPLASPTTLLHLENPAANATR